MRLPKRVLLYSCAAITSVQFFSGCVAPNNPVPGGTITYTIPDLPESGFLSDYSQMTLARQPEFAVVGRKVYVNPDANLNTYDKVIIDPVSFKYYDNALPLDAAEKERLTRYLEEWLDLKLKDRFRKVAVPNPQTLRVRTAITSLEVPDDIEAKEASMADIFMAVVELELVDSETGERFFAMIDPMGGVRFTIAKQDLSGEREVYIDWMDGLAGDMEDQALNTAHDSVATP